MSCSTSIVIPALLFTLFIVNGVSAEIQSPDTFGAASLIHAMYSFPGKVLDLHNLVVNREKSFSYIYEQKEWYCSDGNFTVYADVQASLTELISATGGMGWNNQRGYYADLEVNVDIGLGRVNGRLVWTNDTGLVPNVTFDYSAGTNPTVGTYIAVTCNIRKGVKAYLKAGLSLGLWAGAGVETVHGDSFKTSLGVGWRSVGFSVNCGVKYCSSYWYIPTFDIAGTCISFGLPWASLSTSC